MVRHGNTTHDRTYDTHKSLVCPTQEEVLYRCPAIDVFDRGTVDSTIQMRREMLNRAGREHIGSYDVSVET